MVIAVIISVIFFIAGVAAQILELKLYQTDCISIFNTDESNEMYSLAFS